MVLSINYNIIQENITMEMAEGLTYLIRVAGYQGKEGDFTLNITPTAGRILVTGFTGNGAISPDGASMQTAEETVTRSSGIRKKSANNSR